MKPKLKVAPVFLYLIFILFLFAWELVSKPLESRHILGASITLFSFVLWIISRFQLDKSFSIKPKATNLVRHGIYSKIRHPVYVFSLLALLGITIFFSNQLLVVLFILALGIQTYRAKKEEQVLFKKFGEEYRQYKSQTWF